MLGPQLLLAKAGIYITLDYLGQVRSGQTRSLTLVDLGCGILVLDSQYPEWGMMILADLGQAKSGQTRSLSLVDLGCGMLVLDYRYPEWA